MKKISRSFVGLSRHLAILLSALGAIALAPNYSAAQGSLPAELAPYGRLVGNGGDVLVCKNKSHQITNIELLDHYEAKTIRGLSIDFEVSSSDIEHRLEVAFSRLKRLSPDRSEKYKKWAQDFVSEAQFLKDIELVDVPDSEHIVIPKGCHIQQIANQATTLLPGQKRYTIDLELWQQLNPDQKAGLILHELVYREALLLGQVNSVASRFLASLMASPKLLEFSQSEFVDLLKDLGFTTVRVQGVLIELLVVDGDDVRELAVDFYPSGRLRSAQVVNGSDYIEPLMGQVYFLRGQTRFHENGVLSEALLSQPAQYIYEGQLLQLEPQLIRFHSNSKLALAVLQNSTPFQSENFALKLNGHVQFYPSGRLQMAKIESGQWLSPWGPCRLTSMVQFYESGIPAVLTVMPAQISVLQQMVQVDGILEFYPEGQIKVFTALHNIAVQTASGLIQAFQYMPIELYSSGVVRRLTLAQAERLKNPAGQKVRFPARTEVLFDENGFAFDAE